jgi:hypothetical protein
MARFWSVTLGLAALGMGWGMLATSGVACGRSSDVMGDGTGLAASSGGAGGAPGVIDVGGFEPCAEEHATATLKPVSMLAMLDKSGSMEQNNKWADASAAFTAFFQDPSAGGLQLALRLFPTDDGCDEVACDAAVCAEPQVPLDLLSNPTHQQSLIALLTGTTPAGWTPMSAVLDGAGQWAHARVVQTAGAEKVVILLVTDGEPHGCDENVANIAGIAAGVLATDGVETFVVGLPGAGQATIDAIAAAGGTTQGFLIGSGNTQADLVAALNAIRGQSVACSFPVPPPTDPADPTNPALVSVKYTASASGEVVKIPKVAGAADCGADGGWYYDNEQSPTTITLCPTSCAQVEGDVSAALDVAIGCECQTDADCPAGTYCQDGACRYPCTDDSTCGPDEQCGPDGRCRHRPGDVCQTDADCPPGMQCIGGQCTWGDVFVGRTEAVQGGAFSCAFGPSARPPSERRGVLPMALGLATLGLLRLRRRAAPGPRASSRP